MKRLAVILTIIGCTNAFCQSADTLEVRMITNVKSDRVQLRWAVNAPIAWKKTNQYGYRLERYTIVRDSKALDIPEKLVLSEIIKPAPELSWTDLAKRDPYAAIIVQAIHGKTFELTGDDAKGVSRIIALAQELEQRYLISTYASELSFDAARMAGWGFEDKLVKKNERYLYRVVALVPPNELKINAGSALANMSIVEELPKPLTPLAVFGDKTVLLTWDYQLLSRYYTAYFLEKSEDGKNYRRLTDTPITNISGGNSSSRNILYTDTLRFNQQLVHYRITGINSFGENGPYSDIVSGKGRNILIYNPHISGTMPLGNDLQVNFEFDERGNQLLRKFELRTSDEPNGVYRIAVDNINPSARTVLYHNPEPTNYFVIAAIPHDGEETVSFPVLVQAIDSIPPMVPTGLRASIDTTGIVNLTWNANTDSDILGYRLFRSDDEHSDLLHLNDDAVEQTTFTDTVDARTINHHVYYAIAALDKRYNQSEISSRLALEKPDILPPTSPVFISYTTTAGSVDLKWVNGKRDRLREVRLYRRRNNETDELVASFPPKQRNFRDTTVLPQSQYTYYLEAISTGGKKSAPSPEISIRSANSAPGEIQSFEVVFSKKEKGNVLKWKHNITNVKEFQIFRAFNNEPMALWRTVSGFDFEMIDTDAKKDAPYKYIIRAILEDGRTGGVKSIERK